jgi:hypothetical protein
LSFGSPEHLKLELSFSEKLFVPSIAAIFAFSAVPTEFRASKDPLCSPFK